MNKPLAHKLRPKTIDDIIGQEHLVGKNAPIRNFINNKKVFSMILYGPPGTGKTTIASVICNIVDYKYRCLNAVINDKKDIITVIEEAKMYNGLILVLDEIHRLNKDKQDILLPHLESGLITLIGLTTSNPYFKINNAVRSRCVIFELTPLKTSDIEKAINKAIKTEYLKDIKINKDAINLIARLSSGDLRNAYNLLEICYYSSSNKKITVENIRKLNNKPVLMSDKDESNHYDLLSALQKSIRGSDVNASIHYLSRLLVIDDLDSIFRRLSVIVYEDIGLANPALGPRLDAVINAVERIGMPEGRIPLSSIVIQMALSPKSNSSYLAINSAIEDIKGGNNYPIPETIKITSEIYKYPHNYKGSYVKQQYMPDNLLNKKYYSPKLNNKYEQSLNETLKNIEKINKE